MSRIYTVKQRAAGHLVRYVRAHTLNGAVRAVADDLFEATATTTEELFQAAKEGTFVVLDALEAEKLAEPPKLSAVK